ncbi:uncharacterized protein TNCV_3210331 [Trichonephila clavipes]|nr:uncharacterized protein TNCV_3210331 [Trichonephila clavipes]
MIRKKWYTQEFLAESEKLLETAPTTKDAGLTPPTEGLSSLSKYPGHLPDIACYHGNLRNQSLVGVDWTCVNMTFHNSLDKEV